MDDCIFCKIISREIPSKILFEDDYVFSFDDISPQAPVHVIIMPKRHIQSVDYLTKFDDDYIKHICLSFPKIARIKGIADDGYRIVSNHLSRAGQSVYHLHFHLLGGRDMKWPPG